MKSSAEWGVPNVARLIEVLAEARELVARPGNDFSWSSWVDADHALTEIDQRVAQLRAGREPFGEGTGILFVPSGPMQELSLSSGWGGEFCQLADRYDQAMAEDTCLCLNQVRDDLIHLADIGTDSAGGESSVHACPDCGQTWLRHLRENEGFTRSGQWVMAPITPEERNLLEQNGAYSLITSKPWHYFGGSYYGATGRTSGAAR